MFFDFFLGERFSTAKFMSAVATYCTHDEEAREEVKRVLNLPGASMKAVVSDGCGDNALYCAVKHGYLDLAQELIEAGVDVNKNGSGFAPILHCALGFDPVNIEMVQLLIDSGSNRKLESFDKKETPFSIAKTVHPDNQELLDVLSFGLNKKPGKKS